MTEQEIALIASKVVNDTKFLIGLIGIIGALIGAFVTIIGNFAIEYYKAENQRKLDTTRQNILKKMLKDEAFEWRTISTLSAVIGCGADETKHHLIAIKARGSETDLNKWGLISRHPLENIR
jgi:hypothetical protein